MAYPIYSSNRLRNFEPSERMGIQEFLRRKPVRRPARGVPYNKINRLINRQYKKQKDGLQDNAALTSQKAGQLFLKLHLCVSFIATYELEIFGNYSFLTIHREDEDFLPKGIDLYKSGEHVAEVDNAKSLQEIMPDLDRLAVWDWRAPEQGFPGCDGWTFGMSLMANSKSVHTGGWCFAPPGGGEAISKTLIEFIRVVASAFGHKHFVEEFEVVARRLNMPPIKTEPSPMTIEIKEKP